ncbi:MAG: hypothetical protein H7Z42_02310 [Roseiflexaceae bacterium]|nr:hypothetical protein [Roseiflexaceae bacterium]
MSASLFMLLGVALTAPATPTTAATALFSWNTVAPSPIERFEAQGLMVNGKLYVFGGFYNNAIQATVRSDVYDPSSNTWTRIADMPEPLTHAGQASDGNTIYIVGGYVGDSPGPSTDHVWKYDIATNTWSAGPSLLAPRGGGAAVRVGRSLHFIGGATRDGNSKTAIDRDDHMVLALDGSTSWSTAAALPNPRNHLAGVALNNKIYLIGGQQGELEGTENQQDVDVYDPATNAWSQVAGLPTPRGHISASTFVMSDRILVIGGSVNDGSSGDASRDVSLYDPQENVWLALPPLPAGRKTPVAGGVDTRIVVATGNEGAPTTTTWVGALHTTWEKAAAAPTALGEVAGGRVGNKLYFVGEGDSATLAYNLSDNTWNSAAQLSQRPLAGNHHAAEVIDGKLYLFGGLGSGAGKVQIYNPATDTWTLGTDMPFAAGSSASSLINGQVYVAGGIIGNQTTNRVAKYDPRSNSWTPLAPMPQGRNHAASSTDGSNLYVFGGRGAGSGDNNSVANGFDTLQIYDPASNTWQSSLDTSSTLAVLPQARGGMGKAVYHDGEFYIIGGETLTGAGATAEGVYDRVDIYNPQTNLWRLGTPLPTARHGIFPLAIAGRIYVAGGGIRAGGSSSSLLEIYNAGALVAPPDNDVTQPVAPGTERLYLPFMEKGADTSPEAAPPPTATPTLETTAVPGQPTTTPTATAPPTSDATTTATTTAVLATATATATATPTATPTATATPTNPGNFTTITWSAIASQPQGNSEAQSAVVGGKLYSFSGFAPCCTPTRRAYVYDPAINKWTRIADMPWGVTHAGITTDGTNIYYAGGYRETDDGRGQMFGTREVWRYNVATDTYTPMPKLPIERAAGVLALVGRNLHYFGGTNKARTVDVGDHYVLSLDGGTAWTIAAPLPNPRHHMGGVVLDGQIYAIGGQHKHDGGLVPQNSVHRYDPATNVWTELASLAIPRNHITNSTVVYGGRVIVFGGQRQGRNNDALDNVSAYDPQTNTWAELTPLPKPLHSAIAAEINGVFYFSTGGPSAGYKGVPGWGAGGTANVAARFAYRPDAAISLFICQ